MRIIVFICIIIIGVILYIRGAHSKEAEPLPQLTKILGCLFVLAAVVAFFNGQ